MRVAAFIPHLLRFCSASFSSSSSSSSSSSISVSSCSFLTRISPPLYLPYRMRIHSIHPLNHRPIHMAIHPSAVPSGYSGVLLPILICWILRSTRHQSVNRPCMMHSSEIINSYFHDNIVQTFQKKIKNK